MDGQARQVGLVAESAPLLNRRSVARDLDELGAVPEPA